MKPAVNGKANKAKPANGKAADAGSLVADAGSPVG